MIRNCKTACERKIREKHRRSKDLPLWMKKKQYQREHTNPYLFLLTTLKTRNEEFATVDKRDRRFEKLNLTCMSIICVLLHQLTTKAIRRGCRDSPTCTEIKE